MKQTTNITYNLGLPPSTTQNTKRVIPPISYPTVAIATPMHIITYAVPNYSTPSNTLIQSELTTQRLEHRQHPSINPVTFSCPFHTACIHVNVNKLSHRMLTPSQSSSHIQKESPITTHEHRTTTKTTQTLTIKHYLFNSSNLYKASLKQVSDHMKQHINYTYL